MILVMMMESILYGFVGFGVTGGTNSISHSAGLSSLIVDQHSVGTFSYDGFEKAVSVGGYIYVDALPVVDLDL